MAKDYTHAQIGDKTYSRQDIESGKYNDEIRKAVVAGQNITINSGTKSAYDNLTGNPKQQSYTPNYSYSYGGRPQAPSWDSGKYVNRINDLYNAQSRRLQDRYHNSRNSVDVTSYQNKKALNEYMANTGLQASGDNVTARTNLANQRQGALNELNTSENESLTNMDISRLNELNNLDKYADNRNMQLYQIENSNFNADRAFGYQQFRDTIGDNRYQQQWDYQVGRDKVNDDRWNKEFDYNSNRDKVNDDRWNQQWQYQTDRDKVSDNRWNQQWEYNTNRDQIADQRYDKEWARDENRYKDTQSWKDKEWNYQVQRDNIKDSQWQQQQQRAAQQRAAASIEAENKKAAAEREKAAKAEYQTKYKEAQLSALTVGNSNQYSMYNFATDESIPLEERILTLLGYESNSKHDADKVFASKLRKILE